MEVQFTYLLGGCVEIHVEADVELGSKATCDEPAGTCEVDLTKHVTHGWKFGYVEFEIDDIDVAGEPLINILKDQAIKEACENE